MAFTPGTLAFFGSYDPAMPRNRLLARAWEGAGGRVIALHEPLWPCAGDRALWARGAGLVPSARRYGRAQAALFARAGELVAADAILVPYPGQFDMPLAWWLGRRLGKPVILDPLIALGETAVEDRGLVAAGSPRARLATAADRLALGLATAVLADTPAQAAFYAERFGVSAERLHVVPVGADGSLFVPSPAPATAGCEVLFYGRMSPLHGLETMLDAAVLLADEPAIRWSLVGQGQEPVAEWLLARGLARVSYTPELPYAALPGAIARADVCLGLFGGSAKAARVVPHKVYEAAAVGRAIASADTPAMRAAFGPEAIALVPAGDAPALAATLRALAADPERRKALGLAARARFERDYAEPAVAAALLRAVAAARRAPR